MIHPRSGELIEGDERTCPDCGSLYIEHACSKNEDEYFCQACGEFFITEKDERKS